MLKHTISISCCIEVAVVLFCKAKENSGSFNTLKKSENVLLSNFLTVYDYYFYSSRSSRGDNFTITLTHEEKFIARFYHILHESCLDQQHAVLFHKERSVPVT